MSPAVDLSAASGDAAAWSAVQQALAAEHQAVFGYDLAGPQLSGAQRTLAAESQTAHEQLRNATVAALSAAGLTPVAPLADYPRLYPVGSAARARALAVRLEDDCAAAWRFVYARAASTGSGSGSPGRLRDRAQTGLTGSATRAARWRLAIDPARPFVAFPGT